MRQWLKEPLLHFAVLGAALFIAYAAVGPSSRGGEAIVVTADQIASLKAQFQATWQRPPTDDELRAILDGHVRDEVLYREGLALGLDQDDPVIRNRVKQKMEFLGEDTLAREPTDADLAAYLAAHPAKFQIPATVSFEQVYFDPARRGAALYGDIASAMASLGKGHSAATLGDTTMLAGRMDDALPHEITTRFGAEFASGIASLPEGSWQGPIQSTYGMHLVRITSRGTSTMPTLADARDIVAREWTRARTLDIRERFYRSLRQRYTVTIEPAAVASAEEP